MKYENKKQVDAVCKQIDKAQELLNNLSGESVEVVLFNSSQRFVCIQTWGDSPYKEHATTFVDTLQAMVKQEIALLKLELDKL